MSRNNYDRFVYLVASVTSASGPAAEGVGDHLKALGDAVLQEEIEHARHEPTHGISVEYDETDIAKVEDLRKQGSKDRVIEKDSGAKGQSNRDRRNRGKGK